MKVLHLTTHLNIGGISNYIFSLSRALKRRDVDCLVVSSGGDMEEEFGRHHIDTVRLDMRTKSEFGLKVLMSIPKLRDIIKNSRIDIVHAHTRVAQVLASFASRLTGTPYITTCHGFFKKRLGRMLFDSWGERVIAISAPVRDSLLSDFRVDAKRIALIHNGVDIDGFPKRYSDEELSETRRSLDLKDGPVIGTIGRLSPVKGHAFFIRAMRDVVSRYPKAQALIVGDGPEEERLKALTRSSGIEGSVYFLRSDLKTSRFLSIMDIFVFPSVKEGLGMALLEALASGKPCVASDVGGITDAIENGLNGILIPVKDPGAIRDAILTLLADERLRNKMGDEGRLAVSKKFTLDIMADKVLSLYKEVLGSGMKAQRAAF